MTLSPTLLQSVFSEGARAARMGEYMMVEIGLAAFAVSVREFEVVQGWARGRNTSGNRRRDVGLFTDRFEVLLAKRGTSARGAPESLRRIRDDLASTGMSLEGWAAIPPAA